MPVIDNFLATLCPVLALKFFSIIVIYTDRQATGNVCARSMATQRTNVFRSGVASLITERWCFPNIIVSCNIVSISAFLS